MTIDSKPAQSITGSGFPVAGKSDIMKSATTVTASQSPDSNQYKDGVLQGFHNGNPVELHPLDQPLYRAAVTLRPIFQQIRRLQHENVLNFICVAVNDEQQCEFVVYGLAFKGSLIKLLRRTHFNLDWHFKASLIKDLVGGMTYLHGINSSGPSHGNLNAYNCRIDSNFVLKISDFGLHPLRNQEDLAPLSEYDAEDRNYELLLWRAPELLRRIMPANGTQQIILRSPPFRTTFVNHRTVDENVLSDKELVTEVL
ncbi:hypothetical protein RvY_13213 [Ramazzottius varieornatus]|uniref:guanylate cyclase n=1 Tax=Ramazzottius varieornatus TaxID=947166 RepID=A0A1D1VM58_RAMVA|nr:hypothetical protein RvY_13213 [Ramazzottius varieornatus]